MLGDNVNSFVAGQEFGKPSYELTPAYDIDGEKKPVLFLSDDDNYNLVATHEVMVLGGTGNDFISAAPGNKLADTFGRHQVGVTIDGGAGNDTIIGGNSNAAAFIQDVIDQHEEDGDAAAAEAVRGLFDLDTIDIDVLRGGDGDDQIFGLGGTNEIYGDAGNDIIYGGENNDFISGGLGDDELYGGGNDVVIASDGNDYVHLGRGFDTIVFGDRNTYLDLHFSSNGEAQETGYGQDVFATWSINSIIAGAGNYVRTNNKDTTLDLGLGDNTIKARDGDDIFIDTGGNETIIGGGGENTIIFDVESNITLALSVAITYVSKIPEPALTV